MPFAAVSDGTLITAADLSNFDVVWMRDQERTQFLNDSAGALAWRYLVAAWGINERMSALERMYELTHDWRYLSDVRDLINVALLPYRDDRYPGSPGPGCFKCDAHPTDEVRGANLPAWGGATVDGGDFNRVDENVSNLYAYPIARFARIVLEDPGLRATYGAEAVADANAVMQTAWVFMPQIGYSNVGNFTEAYFASFNIRNKFSAQDWSNACQAAYQAEYNFESNGSTLSDEATRRLQGMRNNCNNAYLGGGFPMAHNEQKLFMMVLIELQRALDTDFYRHSPQSANAAEPTRVLIPLVVSRHQRYFVDRLQTRTDDSYGPRYYWHYMDDVPAGINTHTEDTSHGQVDMQYLDVLRRNYDRLNALASARGEPILLDTTQVRLGWPRSAGAGRRCPARPTAPQRGRPSL